MAPKVSVNICCYNSEKFVKQTIESVLRQTFSDFEIVIINDGSTDRTEEIVKSFDDKRIHYFYQDNRGLSVSRNKAIELSKGNYIALLDHDDIWLPGKLEKEISLLEKNREIGLCFSDAYIIDEKGRRKGSLFKICQPHSGMIFEELLKENFIPILTTVIRKEVFKEIGVFNPQYRIAEDWDFFLRVSKRFPIDFVNQPLAEYRVHARSFSMQRDLMLTEAVSIIDKYTSLVDKTTAEMLKIIKCKLQLERGIVYLHRGMRRKARDYFLAKIKEKPFSFCFYKGLIATYLPDICIKFIGQILSSKRLFGLKYA